MPSSRCVLPVPTGPCSTNGLADSPGASTTLMAEACATRLHGPTTNSLSLCQRRVFRAAGVGVGAGVGASFSGAVARFSGERERRRAPALAGKEAQRLRGGGQPAQRLARCAPPGTTPDQWRSAPKAARRTPRRPPQPRRRERCGRATPRSGGWARRRPVDRPGGEIACAARTRVYTGVLRSAGRWRWPAPPRRHANAPIPCSARATSMPSQAPSRPCPPDPDANGPASRSANAPTGLNRCCAGELARTRDGRPDPWRITSEALILPRISPHASRPFEMRPTNQTPCPPHRRAGRSRHDARRHTARKTSRESYSTNPMRRYSRQAARCGHRRTGSRAIHLPRARRTESGAASRRRTPVLAPRGPVPCIRRPTPRRAASRSPAARRPALLPLAPVASVPDRSPAPDGRRSPPRSFVRR